MPAILTKMKPGKRRNAARYNNAFFKETKGGNWWRIVRLKGPKPRKPLRLETNRHIAKKVPGSSIFRSDGYHF